MEKSGKKTDKLAVFHRGKAGARERELKLSLIRIVDLQANTSYNLDTRQTLNYPTHSLVESYGQQIVEMAENVRTSTMARLM